MRVKVQNKAGVTREIKVGISWTGLFFGGLCFFFRGMPGYGIIWIILSCFTGIIICNLILMFIINRLTAQYYLEHDYVPIGENWDIAGPKWGINVNRYTHAAK